MELDSSIYRSIIASQISAKRLINAFTIFKQVGLVNCDIGENGCNSLLAALASDGHMIYAREVFDEMLERGVTLNTLGFGVYIWRFCMNAKVDEFLELVGKAKKGVWGVNGSVLAVLIVHGLCFEKRVKDANFILDELRKRECKPDFIAYRVVAEAFRSNGYVVDVGVVLKKKRKLGVAPRANDYREFLYVLIAEKLFWEAKELGDVIVSGNFPIDDDVVNALIESVSTLYPSSSMMFLKFMVGRERFPTLLTLSNFSKNLIKNDKIDDLLELFQLLSSKQYFSDVDSCKMMISCFCKAGRVKEAYEVIPIMKKKGLSPDVSIYNDIIEACCIEGLVRPAKKLWDEMFTSGLGGDLKTYNILIKKFSETGMVKDAQVLFSHMLEKGVVPDSDTYKFLIEGLCKEKELNDAIEMFDKVVQQDPLLARNILNRFTILLCEGGYFIDASKLLCSLSTGIVKPSYHVILLKRLVEAGNFQLAIEHVKLIGQISIGLLREVYRELEADSIPCFSNPNPILQLLEEMKKKVQSHFIY